MSGYEDGFFQTGRNPAEARFWKLKIHEEVDRRQTKSSIAFDGNAGYNGETASNTLNERDGGKSPSRSQSQEPVTSDYTKDYQYSYAPSEADYSKDYHYTYPTPRDRSMSIMSSISSRSKQFTASKDYQYSYPGELDEGDEHEQKEEQVKEEFANNAKEEKEEEKEKQEEDDETKDESENHYTKEKHNMKTICEKHEQESNGHISSRFY
jgi:hypothetical protein